MIKLKDYSIWYQKAEYLYVWQSDKLIFMQKEHSKDIPSQTSKDGKQSSSHNRHDSEQGPHSVSSPFSGKKSNWFSANTSQNSLVKKGNDSVEISTKESRNRH